MGKGVLGTLCSPGLGFWNWAGVGELSAGAEKGLWQGCPRASGQRGDAGRAVGPVWGRECWLRPDPGEGGHCCSGAGAGQQGGHRHCTPPALLALGEAPRAGRAQAQEAGL